MAGELNSLVTRWLKQVLMSVWSPTECGRCPCGAVLSVAGCGGRVQGAGGVESRHSDGSDRGDGRRPGGAHPPGHECR
eukprot:1890382-Pyramimonas_sp.AAC.1